VCDLETRNLGNEEVLAHWGLSRQKPKEKKRKERKKKEKKKNLLK
jgi:hypothetical protein